MKAYQRYFVIAIAGIGVAMSAMAQESSSSVVRKRGAGDRNNSESSITTAQVSERMQAHFAEENVGEADQQWMRVIYRQLDLTKEKNAALYYPEDIIDGDENLFRIIMRLLANNQIAAYEYLDGREIFTDQYRIKVREMLDRFQVLYTTAKGSTENNLRFTIEESDVPTNEVLSYYIIERWSVNNRSNTMKTEVEAICPVLHRAGDFGGEAIKYPMFWVRFADLKPYLATQYVFIDDDNNLAKYTYADFFQMNMYKGDIYKTRNLRNKSMNQLYTDADDLKRAQDSIQNRLDTYTDKMWVPSREEIIAAREAREAKAAGVAAETDSIATRQTVNAKKETTTRSTRSSRSTTKTKTKTTKVKTSKPKTSSSSSSSSATRSVRRRK
jgi:gliding motility associated protien GldN